MLLRLEVNAEDFFDDSLLKLLLSDAFGCAILVLAAVVDVAFLAFSNQAPATEFAAEKLPKRKIVFDFYRSEIAAENGLHLLKEFL